MQTAPPTAATFGDASAPLVVAVDDAWFEGNRPLDVASLDASLALRSRSPGSLKDLVSLCRAASSPGTDLLYLLALAQMCLAHHFRLVLCNFEYAEKHFRDEFNRESAVVFFDVGYANRFDEAYGTSLVLRLHKQGKFKADVCFGTGLPRQIKLQVDRNADSALGLILDRFRPVVVKGTEDAAKNLEQVAQYLDQRAAAHRFQFWSRFGDGVWTVVFDGGSPIRPDMDVPVCYLALLVARPNQKIHPLWLDMINAAEKSTKRNGKLSDTTPRDLRLHIVTEYLRRKVGDLSEPPTAAALSEVEELSAIDLADDARSNAAVEDASDLVAEEAEINHPTAKRRRLASSEHVRGLGSATPLSESTRLKDIIQYYTLMARNPRWSFKKRDLEDAIRHLKENVGRHMQEPSRDQWKNLIERVQKNYERARDFFKVRAKVMRGREPALARLSAHFSHPKTLPKGIKGKSEFVYHPSDGIVWTTTSLD